VPIFIDLALKNEPLIIHGDGEQTRDFVYVKDIVAANAFFATQSDATGVFNVACGERTTINDLARTILRLTNSRSEIQHTSARPGDVIHSVASIDKARSAGFRPTTSVAGGLKATIEFFSASGFQR
jgi:UDP-glucose 4-epimerase